MFSLIIPGVLAALPAAYELDFRALPAPEPKGTNEYTIVLSFKGESDVRIPTTIARKYGPGGAASFFMEGLSDHRWKLKQDGNQVTIYGYDDVRISKVTVVGDGPKPLVRWVPLVLPEKK